MRIIPFRIKAHEDDDNYSDVYEFLIEGSKKDAYEIEIDIDSLNDLGITDTRCTCPDHTFRGSYCKHIQSCVKILGCFDIDTSTKQNTSIMEFICFECGEHNIHTKDCKLNKNSYVIQIANNKEDLE